MTVIPGVFKLTIPLLLFAFSRVLVAAEDIATIAFFRAIQDEAVYAKNPTKYERLVVNDRT